MLSTVSSWKKFFKKYATYNNLKGFGNFKSDHNENFKN